MARIGKYNAKIVDRICLLIKTDSYTVAEICEQVSINQDTYYDWLKNKPEFSDAIKKAKGEFDDFLISEAKKSLVKKIRGYSVQEKKTVTADTGKTTDEGKPIVKVKEHSVVEKHIQPDTAAIIFTLCNRDSDNWKNRQDTNITGEMTLTSDLDKLSDEELENVVRNGGKIDTDSEA